MDAASHDRADAATLMRRAALAAICAAGGLTVLKLVAWWFSGSVAMLASFADSGLDLLASGLNAYAIRQSLAPADREHRFGHGKTEAVAGLAQAALVAGSAVFLIVQSMQRLVAPQPVAAEALGLGVMAVAIAATFALTLYQARVVRRSGSLAVAADRLHYLSDVAGNIAVVLALVLATSFGWLWADGAFGLLIAATIAWSAWTIGRGALDQLIDRELPDDDRTRIKAIATAVPGVRDVHDLRTRAAGTHVFIQMHMALDAALSLEAAHTITEQVEAAIEAAFPNADVLIHQDPHGHDEPHRPFAFVRSA